MPRALGDDLLLQVDANAAYTVADAGHLRGLDRFGLLLIEQPLAEDDLAGHAELAGRLATPICLDESITSAKAAVDAVAWGRRIVNVKAGRVGGYPQSQAPAEGRLASGQCPAGAAACWRRASAGRPSVALAALLPGFTLGDTSASDRYYRQDDGPVRPPRRPPRGPRRPPGSGSSPFPRSWRTQPPRSVAPSLVTQLVTISGTVGS